MARKFRIKIQNHKPNYNANGRTISCEGVTISDIIKNVYNEVGRWNPNEGETYSQHVGVDPNGEPLLLATYAGRTPHMSRYEYIRDYEGTINSDTDQIEIESILSAPNYSYDQDTEFKNKGKKAIFKYERTSRPYETYDEDYFQHIFNWPTEHTLKERKVGAFINQTNSCTDEVTTFEHSATYPGGTMDLDKVVSELYYIDDKWGYVPLNFNADGTIQDPTGEITDKIGEPVIYHGGTDDDCLFFHYVVDLEDTDAVSTDNLVVIGDTINGATVTNVVNYVTDIALLRIASKHPRKGDTDVDTTAQRFIDLGYTQSDYDATKSWLKLNTSDGLVKGMTVAGRGIRPGTVVTAVDEARNRVYLSETLNNKKVKKVRFFDDLINKVSKNTLCYASISGGSFAVDQNYSVLRNGQSTGITICARAGKGIINRSAIVGTYFSKNKKEIEYLPIFYSADPNCEKATFEDENGEYILGTIVWNDGTRDEGKYLLTNPKNIEAYRIGTIYQSFTYGLIDKDVLDMFITNQDNPNYINIYNEINAYVKTNVGDKKAAGVFDDVCRDDLFVNYSLAYYPFLEANDMQAQISQIQTYAQDECLLQVETPDPAQSIDDFKSKISEIINNSANNSIVLSEDYYKRLISDEDSLMNRLTTGVNNVNKSIPTKTKVDNQPAVIEGQDDSGVRWISKNFRDLPPAMDRVKFFIGDVLVARDKDLDSSLNLDPATTVNQPKIIIRSRPCWNWNGAPNWTNTKTHTGCPATWTSTIGVTVNLNSEGYLDTIKSISIGNEDYDSLADLNEGINEYNTNNPSLPQLSLLTGEQNITVGVGISPPVEVIQCGGDPPSVGTCSRSWAAPTPKDANKNIIFGEKKEPWDFSKVSTQQEGYISATNWELHPSLRDLDNLERSEDEDIKNPSVAIYPKTIWAPNINYQMDFHKMFSFRMEELSELLGESIENSGNPYLDDPIRAKIRRTIQPGDTTITVDSTDGFLSSGYLIIPKYIKKLFTTETGNVDTQFCYCGEEIIYYKSKTATTFENCERELFGTTSDFEVTLPAHSMEVGVRYKIESLGTTNWENVGAGSDPVVGTVFVATKDGDGSGTVKLAGSTTDEIASENIDVYEDPPKIPVISSYETGFSVSQHWIFTLKED